MGSYHAVAAQQRAERGWRAGKVIPHRITMALNLADLYGPEVDEACGVEEPAVDMWEAGTLYPTWEQLCALAELTGYGLAFFVLPLLNDRPVQSSLRFHTVGGRRCDWIEPPPVRVFTPEAIAAANLPPSPTPPTNPTPRPPTGRRRTRQVA